jgi:hypothetical protein
MGQNQKKQSEKVNAKILNAIAGWRLIYDEKRDMYIKIAYVPSVKVEDDPEETSGSEIDNS